MSREQLVKEKGGNMKHDDWVQVVVIEDSVVNMMVIIFCSSWFRMGFHWQIFKMKWNEMDFPLSPRWITSTFTWYSQRGRWASSADKSSSSRNKNKIVFCDFLAFIITSQSEVYIIMNILFIFSPKKPSSGSRRTERLQHLHYESTSCCYPPKNGLLFCPMFYWQKNRLYYIMKF